MDKWFKAAMAMGGAAVSYLFGGWSAMLGVLLTMAVVDYLSGFTAAALAGQLSSAVGMKGIAKKIALFGVVAVAHLIDQSLGEQHLIRDAAIWWYAANEVVSIVENMGRLGVPIPPIITQAVEVLRKRGDAA